MGVLAALGKPGAFSGDGRVSRDEIASMCLQSFHGQVGDGFPQGERAIAELTAMRRIAEVLHGAFRPAPPAPRLSEDGGEPFIPAFLR